MQELVVCAGEVGGEASWNAGFGGPVAFNMLGEL